MAARDEPGLIPRTILFDNPERAAVQISPDGSRLSFLSPVDGVLNVWVGPHDRPDEARPVTRDERRGIRRYQWAADGERILYVQDRDGDENWHVYASHLDSGETLDLTPIDGVAAQIVAVSDRIPEWIVVGINQARPDLHDLYRIRLADGHRELLQSNGRFASFVVDDDYRVRFAYEMTSDGGARLLEPDGEGDWREFLRIAMEDTLTTGVLGFDRTGEVLHMIDSRGRDTGALVRLHLADGSIEPVAEDPRADLGEVLVHPTEHTLQAASFTYDRLRWAVVDPDVEEDFERLARLDGGSLTVVSQTFDARTWIVAYLHDDGPVRYYRYQRDDGAAHFLFDGRPALANLPLVPMHPITIEARDGLPLVSYLTLPGAEARPMVPERPLPLVLYVHGGPWARDEWGFDQVHQWLANRGYAVLSVNFRGSTGFGKRFLNAGNKQWARRMHDDLLDAVDWAVCQGFADRSRVAIMGGSYGGYASLVGLTFTPEVFACGVSLVGPSNLVTLLNTIPPYWEPLVQVWKARVGDHTTKEGVELLEERSPLTFVDRICRPLLIGQGANDPRVKQSESDQIVQAMQARDIPVTYLLYPDEGHGFARPENSQSFYAVTEAFLAQHLGGRFQEIGEALTDSRVQVRVGARWVPGLEHQPVDEVE